MGGGRAGGWAGRRAGGPDGTESLTRRAEEDAKRACVACAPVCMGDWLPVACAQSFARAAGLLAHVERAQWINYRPVEYKPVESPVELSPVELSHLCSSGSGLHRKQLLYIQQRQQLGGEQTYGYVVPF